MHQVGLPSCGHSLTELILTYRGPPPRPHHTHTRLSLNSKCSLRGLPVGVSGLQTWALSHSAPPPPAVSPGGLAGHLPDKEGPWLLKHKNLFCLVVTFPQKEGRKDAHMQ